MTEQPVTLQAADGQALAATRFDPAPGSPPRGAILMVAAMGIPQRFYAPLARWLATRGYCVLTFDFRGIGRSRPASLRRFSATIDHWIERDCPAALEALQAASPGQPLTWLAHSLGGQVFPLVPGSDRVARMVTVASGSGFRGYHPLPMRLAIGWLWGVLVPLSLKLFGYFPGRRLRKLGDLPAGAIGQWRRWCQHPDYLFSEKGEAARRAFAAVRCPVTFLAVEDDPYQGPEASEFFARHYLHADAQVRVVRRDDAGGRAIGHVGFFKPRFEASLWPDILWPLLEASGGATDGHLRG